MKKIIYIAIYISGIACFSACRSTSSSCGLADNITINQILVQQLKTT